MKPDTTIAILTHNRSWHFAQCIASIRQFTRAPYVIKVLDVGSDLNHIEHVKQFSTDDCELGFADEFLSCAEGRRRLLRLVDTEYIVYLDDDIRVGPCWLQNLHRPMRKDPHAAAVAANIVQEGQKAVSGVRYMDLKGDARIVRQHELNYEGDAPISLGGATLYRLDVLKETEYRPEFSGGFEDWDQTLQITQDLNRTIYGSRAIVFHYHQAECRGYFEKRWRWRELFEAALAMWDRWQIRSGVDSVMSHHVRNQIAIPRDLAERALDVIT